MEGFKQFNEPEKEPARVSDELATESGFRSFRANTASIEDFQAAHDKSPETVEGLRREAMAVAEYLFKARKEVPSSSPDRPQLERLLELVSQMSEGLSSFVFFRNQLRDDPTSAHADVFRLAVEDLGVKLKSLQTEFAAVPIESGLNRWRMMRALRKVGLAAGLLVAGAGVSDSILPEGKQSQAPEATPHLVGSDRVEIKEEKTAESSDVIETPAEGGGKASRAKRAGGKSEMQQDNSGAESPSEGERKSSLAKHEAGEPNMRQNNDEAGRFSEEIDSLGSISYEWSATPDDSLWINGYQVRTAQGWESVAGPRSNASDIEEGADFASVKIDLSKAAAGEMEIVLPVPVNKEIKDVRVSGAVGTYNPQTHTFTFQTAPTSGTLTYQVVKPVYEPTFDFKTSGVLLQRPDNPTALEKAQYKNRALLNLQYKELLQSYLGNFTYVVSSDLQDSVLDKLPGSIDEKAANLLVGDCDMLSAAGVRMLAGESEFSAAIASGFLEKEQKIDGNSPHAKIYYRNELIEATQFAKRALVNVKLRDSDREELSRLAEAVAAAGDEGAREAAYTTLREQLQQALQDPHYDQFKNKGGAPELPNFSDLEQLWRELRAELAYVNSWSSGERIPMQMLLGLAGAVALGGIGLIGFKGAQYGTRKTALLGLGLIRNGMRKDVAESIAQYYADDEAPGRAGSPEQVAYFDNLLKSGYESLPFLEQSLPLARALTLPFESKRGLVRLLRAAGSMIDKGKHDPASAKTKYDKQYIFKNNTLAVVIESLMLRRRFAVELSRAGREGIAIDSLTNDLLELARDPSYKQALLDETDQSVKARIERALINLKSLPASAAQKFPVEYRKKVLATAGFETGQQSQDKFKNRRGALPNEEVFGTRDFSAGDDARQIDWLRSARTEKLQVRESPQAQREAPKGKPIELVLDALITTHFEDKLAEFLIAAEQAPGAMHITGVTIVAFGSVVERISAKDLQRLSGEGGQLGPAKFILTRLRQAFAKNAIYNEDNLSSHRLLKQEPLLALPFDTQKQLDVLIFGSVPMKLAGKTAAHFSVMNPQTGVAEAA